MTNQLMPNCLLPLQGAFNFRDMGGLPAVDGRKVKPGLLFRAAELTGLTEADRSLLGTIGLRHIFDYRNREEAALKPDPELGDAIRTRVPANAAAEDKPHLSMEQLFASGLHKLFTADMLLQMYASLPIGNKSYKQLMQLLQEPERNLPLVHHCAGGRDRTGVGSFLILMTLGVPYEAVMDDYLLSNVTLAGYHQELYNTAAEYLSREELDGFIQAMELQPRYLDASKNSIMQNYGTFERYLEAEFGITDSIRQRIQAYCLV